jgi:hypothetical protein
MPVEQLTFTDCPRGTGVDPTATGLQVKACSAGLSPEVRQQLVAICMHHGQAFSLSYAPPAAIEREQAWLTQTGNRKAMPAEILDAFPIIWSYDWLADDLFALTQVRYIGLTHDGRTGNFFAHALVFAPRDLGPHGHNPLALSRSNLFRSHSRDEGTILPTLPDLGASVKDQTHYDLLRAAPYHDRLADMISALCTATPATRPILLCLSDWRQAAPLVEALLDLLPPSLRRRLTICTYESDRTWVPSTGTGRPAGLAAAHHLLVLCGTSDRPFHLRPDEYQSVYTVFNFVGDQFSEITASSRFAAFAARSVIDGQVERLKQHHALTERMGLEKEMSAWDALVPAVDLPDTHPTPKGLAEAAASLATLAMRPEQAQAALDLLVLRARSLAQANDVAPLRVLTSGLAALVGKVATGTPADALSHPVVAELRQLAGDAFAQGHGRTTAALLQACGPARDCALMALLGDALSDSRLSLSSSLDTADREQVVNLLLDGLRLAEEAEETRESDQLLVLTFRVAHEVDLVADVWERIGEALVQARLSGDWDAEKLALARAVVKHTPADCCPEASAWLNLKLLEATRPAAEQLPTMLTEIARAASRSAAAAGFTADVLRFAQERIPEENQYAVVLGRMAEAAHGTAAGQTLFAAYQDVMEQIRDKHRNRIHRKLAQADVVHVLCHELLDEVLPWDDESPNKFQRWRSVVLDPHAQVMDGLRQQVAGLLTEPGQAEARNVAPLVEELMPKPQAKAAAQPGSLALYQAVVLSLPLEPLPDQWSQPLASPPDGLPPEVAARLRVLKFMREIEQRAIGPRWATTEFPYDDPAWQRDVPSLVPDDKSRMLTWCVDTFATTGVTTPEEAQGLTRLLAAVGEESPQSIANVAARLLVGSDPVTCVLVATAFARCALEGAEPDGTWGDIVKEILIRFDKSTLQLFDAHLTHRFCRRDQEYEARLEQLRISVGLSRPQPAALPTKVGDLTTSPSPTPSQPLGVAASVLDSAKRSWRRLSGKPRAPKKTPDHQEDGG